MRTREFGTPIAHVEFLGKEIKRAAADEFNSVGNFVFRVLGKGKTLEQITEDVEGQVARHINAHAQSERSTTRLEGIEVGDPRRVSFEISEMKEKRRVLLTNKGLPRRLRE